LDFLGAFSGLERIVIIGGAMLVGYWGYRMFATDRTPALIFMGVACAVLFAALLSGGSHVRSIGKSYQLATTSAPVPVAEPALPAPAPALLEPGIAPQSAGVAASAAAGDEAKSAPSSDAQEQPAAPAATKPIVIDADAEVLSSQELGGRIVSIKSEAITLEWSPRRQRDSD